MLDAQAPADDFNMTHMTLYYVDKVRLLHGTYVGEVGGLAEGAFVAHGLEQGLLHGTCVGEVDGLAEGEFGAKTWL